MNPRPQIPMRKIDLDHVLVQEQVRPRFDAAVDAAARAMPRGTHVGTEALYLTDTRAWIGVEVTLPGQHRALLLLVELAADEYTILPNPIVEAEA